MPRSSRNHLVIKPQPFSDQVRTTNYGHALFELRNSYWYKYFQDYLRAENRG